MNSIAKDILKHLYKAYLSGQEHPQFNFSGLNVKNSEEEALKELQQFGFITLKTKSIGYAICEITEHGLDYLEDN